MINLHSKSHDHDKERIAALRERCLERKSQKLGYNPNAVLLAACDALRDSEDLSLQIRCGLRTRARLTAIPFVLDELEILGGRVNFRNPSEPPPEVTQAKEYLKNYPNPPGMHGHCALDMAKILKVGIKGIFAELNTLFTAADGAKAETYQSFIYALEGMQVMILNMAKTAEAKIPSASPERKVELQEIISSCHRIAFDPPESFRDALQLTWFVELAVMYGDSVGLVVPGHLDRTLEPFFRADISSGKLDCSQALLLLEQLYLLINENIFDGGAMSIMVGGRNAKKQDFTNELSYLCLEALRRTNLIYPTVGVCWHEDIPEKLTYLAVELIADGYTTPAFFGDNTIQSGLVSYGVPPEEACDYINSTCVEITPTGSSNVWVATPYFSTCKILMDEIAGQLESGDPSPDFETFSQNYRIRLATEIENAVEKISEDRQARYEKGGKPIQSVFTEDCIERGLDIDRGGARYNWAECSFVGLANLADSLQVIQQEVFQKRNLTLGELFKLCESDFAGHESLRTQFSVSSPKYGNSVPEVDRFVLEIIDFAKQECGKYKLQPDNTHFIPGAFCWVMHEQLGRKCMATPDGRRAGTPFADGAGPAQGRERNGPTSAILSTTSWDHSPMIGGVALNLKFNSMLFDSPDAVVRLRDLIVTYLKRGGFEVQVNVVDRELLKKAKADPETYRDLVVRIGGYTDYFTRLSPDMQDEVIMRTEFNQL